METALPSAAFEPQKMFSLNLSEQIRKWSAMCGEVLAWERQHMLIEEPSEEIRLKFVGVLKDLRKWTSVFRALLVDADIDRSVLAEMEGRALQLESAWERASNSMTDAEAEAVFRKTFPQDADLADTLFASK